MFTPLRLLLVISVLTCGTDRLCGQGKLADPFPVLAAGRPLDVKLHGAAAPWLHDFNQDGVKDLLVGEGYEGRLRIYLNHGSSAMPRFNGYSLFKDGMPAGRVPSNNGFCPVIADLDRDGLDDLLTPAWYGHIRWFRQESPGVFAAAEPILN